MTQKPPPANCLNCSTPLSHADRQGQRRSYCDARCWRMHNVGSVKAPTATCPNCGDSFTNDLNRPGRPRRHCSDRCRRAFDDKNKHARTVGQKAVNL